MVASRLEALERSDQVRLARQALPRDGSWVVGGTVRDALLGRPLEDLDLVVPADSRGAAKEIARLAKGHAFELSEDFAAWRMVAGDRSWQADVTAMRGGSIEADLALRDFTVNAIAVPLAGGELIDPHAGEADLDRGCLRAVTERSFRDDPLRTMRMPRLACELGLEVEERTLELARAEAQALERVSPERSYYELRRLVSSPDPLRGLDLMDRAGLIAALLPELEELKGVEQNPYHHLDVWGHTLEVLEQLLEIERDPSGVFGPEGERVTRELARPLADGLTRWEALRLGALLHDIGKPATRAVSPEGRVLFWGHDELGARMSRDIARRLRASAATAEFLAGLALHHLRLGFLVHRRPLDRRDLYRYLRACEPVEVEVTVLSTADRLATRGERTRAEAITNHLDLAREIAAEAVHWRTTGPPDPPLRGDDLIAEFGITPGPRLGELLEQLREAVFAGEIESREGALALMRISLAERPARG
jgi:putative nucleotidyltransferase with HDIG domain